MDLLKFGLTILFIVVYLAVHLSKVWREQKEQEARKMNSPVDESGEATEVDRRIAEAQRRRREQQQEAAALAAGTRPRVARKAIPIQVVETPVPKTRITYCQPAPKVSQLALPQTALPQSSPQPTAPQQSAPQLAPRQSAGPVGLGAVATVAKPTPSPALVQLSALLKDRKNLGAAFLLKEIFDKPISLRK